MTTIKTLVLTHREDVDGILSAANLKRQHGADTEVILVSHRNQDEIFAALPAREDAHLTNLIVTDLTLKTSLFVKDPHVSLIELIFQTFRSIIWIDHHTTNIKEAFINMGGLYLDGQPENNCSAMIVCNELLLDDNHADSLALIAQANDYPNEPTNESILKLGIALQRIITVLNYEDDEAGLQSLLDIIAFDEIWFLEIAKYYLHMKTVFVGAYASFYEQQGNFTIGDYKIRLAIASPILPQKEALRNMREQFGATTAACIGIFPAPVNNILMFKGTGESVFPVADLCKYMGGGSRDGDGGFSLPNKIDHSSFESAAASMTGLLSEFLKTR